ncbi:hypothetical protein ABZP36_004572 [Zizania latifolia]
MATDELPTAAATVAAEESPGFSFSIWPPTQRTRDAVVKHLVDTVDGDTILYKRYGAVPAADAELATRAIDAEAFDVVAVNGVVAASMEEGIKALQLYSKEVSRRLLDFIKSRSAAGKVEPPSEEAPSEGKAVEPQPVA